MNTTHTYSGTQNNGKIISQYDAISGETVQYTYDSLNRLASAQATDSAWGQSYSYDGFGNLTTQTVTAGSAPAYGPVAYTPTTNQWTGSGSVDANGNLTAYGAYDGFNRLIGTYGSFMYSYAPGNKRVWRGSGYTTGWVTNQPLWTTDEITFWSVTGQKLATYQIVITGGLTGVGSASAPTEMYASQTGTNYYFGSKLIKNAGGYVGADRLGSIGHFYPWGQEKPSATQNGTEKFTGYLRDLETGNDYADQRYHVPGTGRFLTPDPSMANVVVTNPGSWNAYSYANGDPINFDDPDGLESCGDITITGGGEFNGETVSQVMTGTSGDDLLAQIIWHEGGTIYSSDLSGSATPGQQLNASYLQDLAAIGTVVLNEWDVDDHRLKVYQHGRAVCPLGQCLNRTLQQIIILIATSTDADGNSVPVFNSSGQMTGAAATQLNGILDTNALSGPLVNGVSQSCEGVLSSIETADGLLSGTEQRVSPNGLTLLFWNQAPASSTTTFPGDVGYIGWRDSRSHGETFWGLSSTPPVRKPPTHKH